MTQWLARFATMSTIVFVCARFWILSWPFPPGLDGAQWLAFGRGLSGVGRSAASAYPPMAPALTAALAAILEPVSAVRVAGLLVLALLCLAFWALLAEVLDPVGATLATALVLPATANAEPFFYGGYPQQAAFAFGLLGLRQVLRAFRAPDAIARQHRLAAASGWFLAAALSHLLYAPLMVASALLTAVLLPAMQPNAQRERGPQLPASAITRPRCFTTATVIATLPALSVSLALALRFSQLGYNAPLGATERSITGAWVYATREAPLVWAVLLAAGIGAGAVIIARSRTLPGRPSGSATVEACCIGVALVLPAGALFAVSGQPRLVPPLLVGAAMLFVAGLRYGSRQRARVGLAGALVIGVLALWLGWRSSETATEFAGFYRVLDASTVDAAAFLANQPDGHAIAVMADRRGWPVGWWYEALQQRPVLTGSDPRWLAFPDERNRAAAVQELFAARNGQELRELSTQLDVDTLVVRKWEWIGWDRWLDDPAEAPTAVFDDGETLILRVPRPKP